MIEKNNLANLEIEQLYLKDNFYLNTQKPLTLSQKIKNKVIKYSRPFSLGIGAYLGFELVKNLFIKTSNAASSLYSTTTNWFGDSVDSINSFILNFYEVIHPKYYFYGVTQILSMISYIVAIGLMINSLRKFKDHNDTKGEIPISQAILLAVAAGLLLILPTLLNMEQAVVITPTHHGYYGQ